MADGEGSSNEGNSQPATGGALVNKIGALTFDAVAQRPCPSCGRSWDGDPADNQSSHGHSHDEGQPLGSVAGGPHTTECGPAEMSQVVTGHRHGVGIQECRAIREELGTRTFLVVLERELMCGRISRRAKTYALYLILEQDFEKTFANIERNEKVVYLSSLVGLTGDLQGPQMRYSIPVKSSIIIQAKLGQGQKFKITSRNKFVTQLGRISQESKDRLGMTSMELQVMCTGSTKEWCEDWVDLTIATKSSPSVRLTFRIWSYCSDHQWLMRASPVVRMPQEDVDALVRCHVDLLDQIHKVPKIAHHLYGRRILEEQDMEEINSINSREGKVADLLKRLRFRGDVLDIFVDILCRTQNRGAAQILHQSRCAVHQAEDQDQLFER